MPAGFHDLPVLDHQNDVGIHDGRQPMGDHQSCAPLAQFGDRLLDVMFGFGIERRSRFVEQDDRGLLHQRSRDGDALALTAGELQAVLTDGRFVAQPEAEDEIMRMRRLGGGYDVGLGRCQIPDGDVLANRPPKKLYDLPHIGDFATQ